MDLSDWTFVPNVGAWVSADHPITIMNPEPAFEVFQVRCNPGGWSARGENTMWFNIKMLSPAKHPDQT